MSVTDERMVSAGLADRLEQIESAARALVEELKRRGSYGHEAMLMMRLEGLLDANPGAVSWRRKT